MVSRAERSAMANWWWTIDRWILAAVGALMVFGTRADDGGKPAGRGAARPFDVPLRTTVRFFS